MKQSVSDQFQLFQAPTPQRNRKGAKREERPDPVLMRDAVLPYHLTGMEARCTRCADWDQPCAVCWWNTWQWDLRWKNYLRMRNNR